MRHCSCLLFCTDNNKMGAQSFSSCFEIHGTVIIHLCQLFLPSPSVNNSMYGDVLSKWYGVTTKEKYNYPSKKPRSPNIVSLQFLVWINRTFRENIRLYDVPEKLDEHIPLPSPGLMTNPVQRCVWTSPF